LTRGPPGHGYRQPLTVADVRAFISLLPAWDEVAVGLDAIVLDSGAHVTFARPDPSGFEVPWSGAADVSAASNARAVTASIAGPPRPKPRGSPAPHEDRKIAADARREATLEAYFDRMNRLILDRNLLGAAPGSSFRQFARTLTLTTLHRLDGERKGAVMRAVQKACRALADLDLNGADLRGADLRGVDLVTLNLGGADFERARFDRAFVYGTSFFDANLRHASFGHAVIEDSIFDTANLADASFQAVDISVAQSSSATTADHGVSFTGACVTRTNFAGAKFAHQSSASVAQ
jgi:pentapeptide repeat protein